MSGREPSLVTPQKKRRCGSLHLNRPQALGGVLLRKAPAAEAWLLDRSRTPAGLAVLVEKAEQITARPDSKGRMLSEDQAEALMNVAVSGRVIDVLVDTAGAGDTTYRV